MKIILTIKSILNYLYNNLIDLVWTKKIRFADGTEMDTLPTSATLFDIKRRSINDISDEKLVQKGWCCISDSQPKRLAKVDVPTAYNFLKDKLDNRETEMTAWIKTQYNYALLLFYYDNYWYFANGKNIYKVQYLDFSNVQLVKQNAFANNYNNTPSSAMCKKAIFDNQTVFICVSFNNVINVRIYDSNWVLLKETNFDNVCNYYLIKDFCVAEDLKRIFILPSVSNTSNTTPYKILVYDYDTETKYYPQITIDTWQNYGTKYVVGCNIVYFNGYIYTATTLKYCKINPNDFTYENKNVSEDGNAQTNVDSYYSVNGTANESYLFTDNINLYLVCSGKYGYQSGGGWVVDGHINRAWELKNDGTWLNLLNDYSSSGSGFLNTLCYATIKNGTFYLVQTSGTTTKIYTTTDFTQYNEVYTLNNYVASTNTLIIINENNEICVALNSNTYINSSIISKVYTDTINGIDIKYYKSGDWKICTPTIAVGNDDNLQSVYEYLGYLNYWWIDTANEQITLQRNSAFETFMYVGDDYEDDSLPSGSYIPYATKQDCGNAGHTIIHKFVGNSGLTLDTGESLGNSCIVFKNGNKLSIVDDYTINGTVITFLTALIPSDKIEVMFGNITSIDLSQFKQKAQTIEIDDASITIDNVSANKNYVFTSNAITDITLTACETSMEETTIQFTTGSSAPTLTDNSGLVWFGGIPTLLPNTTYVIVIFNKQAFYQEN